MNEQTKAGFLSAETNKLREDARKTAEELATVNSKCDKIVNTDGDVDAQTKALAELHARRDILAAKLARLKASLFEAVQQDARASYEAADIRLQECTAKKAALRDVWRDQVKADVKDGNARGQLANNSRYWPSELRTCDHERTLAFQALTAASQLVAALDWDAYEAARLGGVAAPQTGTFEGRAAFWTRAARFAPELLK
jgi:hypothetical protein